jgi:alkanesulfonate monooxygenase SsuD/methylene tetrahydromethanopterin reductase-like flavin-dependent oxidoreductase (luciferase family)
VFDQEHEGLGVPFPPVSERFERLEETVQICLQMWSEDNGPFSGKHYQLAETLCVPAPISAPRPPIMIAGGGEKKTLKLVARYADSCNLFGSVEEVTAKLDILRGHCETEGRDYATITPTVMVGGDPFADLDAFVRDAERYAALGVGVLFLIPQGDPVAFAERVGADVVPRLKQLG